MGLEAQAGHASASSIGTADNRIASSVAEKQKGMGDKSNFLGASTITFVVTK